MAKDPAVLWYWNDWQGGTVTLTRHLKGCYMDLLHAQFNNGRLSLAQVKTVLGVDFGTAWPLLQEKFKKDGNDNYYNERAEEEKLRRSRFVESRSNNKAGRKKKSHDKSYDLKMNNHMENENVNENTIVVKEGVIGGELPAPVNGIFTDMIDKQIELTDLQISNTIEFIRLTTGKTLTVQQVKDNWDAFKINQFYKHEWYPSYEDVLSHFRNLFKKQKINEPDKKLGTSEARVAKGSSW